MADDWDEPNPMSEKALSERLRRLVWTDRERLLAVKGVAPAGAASAEPDPEPQGPAAGEVGDEPGPAGDAGDIHSISGALARLKAREAALAAKAAERGPAVSNRPLDQVVEDVLRPILSDWLDRNLERIVREQVDAALQAEIAARDRERTPGN